MHTYTEEGKKSYKRDKAQIQTAPRKEETKVMNDTVEIEQP